MRVRIFKSANTDDLQKEINNFLAGNSYNFIDIKWAASDGSYSALVMFKM